MSVAAVVHDDFADTEGAAAAKISRPPPWSITTDDIGITAIGGTQTGRAEGRHHVDH